MKRRTIVLTMGILTLTLASCINIFSVFNAGNTDNIDNEARLLAMGETYVNNMRYEEAYNTYLRVLEINPANSRAREGVATAYLFWKVPLTNVIISIINEDYASIGMDNLYDASQIVASNLWYVISGNGDNIISDTDNNLNLNHFIFNTLYAVFMLADSDGDGSILADTNDIYTIYPDFSFSNHLPDVSNFVEVCRMIYHISLITNKFELLYGQSLHSLSNVEMTLTSQDARDMVAGIRTPVEELKLQMDSYLTQFDAYDSVSQFGITSNEQISGILTNGGYTNYADLTNDLASVGITNMDDVTNYFPDLTNFAEILTNTYGL